MLPTRRQPARNLVSGLKYRKINNNAGWLFGYRSNKISLMPKNVLAAFQTALSFQTYAVTVAA